MKTHLFPFLLIVVLIFACQKAEDPNSLSGDPKTGFSNVGDTNSAFVNLSDFGLNGYLDCDFAVVSNENGIVKSKGVLKVDTALTHRIDTILGTATLPQEIKRAVREKLIRVFNAKVDSSDKNNIKIELEINAKVTTEGIQDFHHSENDFSKPFTLVKYSAKVGDKYEFTDNDGNHFVREVTYRSSDNDYPVGFWLIKVIKVEETITEGPYKDFLGKITYYTNHKFGLVGVEWDKNGKIYKITVFPQNL